MNNVTNILYQNVNNTNATTTRTIESASLSSSSSSLLLLQQWMITILQFRTYIFDYYLEPCIVYMFGPLMMIDNEMIIKEEGDDVMMMINMIPKNDNNNIIPMMMQKMSSFHNVVSNTTLTHFHHDDDGSNNYSDDIHNETTMRMNDNNNNNNELLPLSSLFTYNNNNNSFHHRRRLNFLPSYVSDITSLSKETSMSFITLSVLFVSMVTLSLILLSCFYHNQKTSPLFISPRKHRLPNLVPPALPIDGYLAWMKICFYISDEEIIHRIGYDSLIFLRFHRLALRCIVKMSVFSFIVLLPLNFTGEGHANAFDIKEYVGSLFFTDFLLFTMANVQMGSPRLWVHCFAAYLLTAIVIRELLREYETFHNIRHRYLLSKEPHLRTVLVTNIPRHLRSSHKIESYFRNVYPNAVKHVILCQNLVRLEDLVVRRTAILSSIEQELLLLCRSEKKKLYEPILVRRMLSSIGHIYDRCCTCCCSDTGSMIPYPLSIQERLAKLYEQLEQYNIQIEHEQRRRKRVMIMLDRMSAGKDGVHDIDYVLAAPFVTNNVTNEERRILGLPPMIAEHRNGPSSMSHNMDNSAYTSPSEGAIYTNEGDNAETDEVVGGNTSNQLRSRSPLNPVDGSILPPLQPDDKKKLKAYNKARKAIKRYGKFNPDSSFLGKPMLPTTTTTTTDVSTDGGTIEDHINEVTDKAFVVMRTFTAATIAIQSMHSSKPGAMQVTTAPEPRDILWNNIYMSKGAHRTRSYLGEFLVLLIITFYVVPMAMVSLLVSESALISSSPRLAQLSQASAFFAAAISLVQPLFIVGLQQLLPPLFMAIGRAEGITSFSEIQMRTFSRYFLFQVINVFLVTTIAGSIFDAIALIVEKPESAFEMLGTSLPRLSAFFITFVTVKTFLGLGFELVRIMSLFQATARFLLFPNATLRQKRTPLASMRAIDDPGWFPFHKVLAQDMLVVVISVVFAVVAPLVTLPCALFCLCSRIVWTHQHLYVYESVFESGGQFWPKIFRRFVFGLIVAQMTITGQFILKDARHEAYATIALMFLTYFFLRATRSRFDPTSSALPLEVATVMDISLRQDEAAEMASSEWRRRQLEALNGARNTDQQQSCPPEVGVVPPPNINFESNNENGNLIGRYDPFENAYVQPALRANPRARPEQPFPVAQLGPDDAYYRPDSGESISTQASSWHDSRATVRLKSMNQHDRRLINAWWNDQLQRAGEQNVFAILIGEECGTLTISGLQNNEVELNHQPSMSDTQSFV